MPPTRGTFAEKLTLRSISADGSTPYVRRRDQTLPAPQRRNLNSKSYLSMQFLPTNLVLGNYFVEN